MNSCDAMAAVVQPASPRGDGSNDGTIVVDGEPATDAADGFSEPAAKHEDASSVMETSSDTDSSVIGVSDEDQGQPEENGAEVPHWSSAVSPVARAFLQLMCPHVLNDTHGSHLSVAASFEAAKEEYTKAPPVVDVRKVWERLVAQAGKPPGLSGLCVRSLAWRFFLGMYDDAMAYPKEICEATGLPSGMARSGMRAVLRAAGSTRRQYAIICERTLAANPSLDPRVDANTVNPLMDDGEGDDYSAHYLRENMESEVLKDINRLHPRSAFFGRLDVRVMLTRILVVWCLEHPDIAYRQGMHELAAPLLYTLAHDLQLVDNMERKMTDDECCADPALIREGVGHSCPTSCPLSEGVTVASLIHGIPFTIVRCPHSGSAAEYEEIPFETIYAALYDPAFIEHEVFFMFDRLMKHCRTFYEPPKMQKRSDVDSPDGRGGHDTPGTKKRGSGGSGMAASSQWSLGRIAGTARDILAVGSPSPMSRHSRTAVAEVSESVKYCQAIVNQLLRTCSVDVYRALNRLDIEPQVYLIRWVRLLFGREFPFPVLLEIWDVLLSERSREQGMVCDNGVGRQSRVFCGKGDILTFLPYMCVAMLHFVGNEVMGDVTQALARLMRFPPVEDPWALVELARGFKSGKVRFAEERTFETPPYTPVSAAAVRRRSSYKRQDAVPIDETPSPALDARGEMQSASLMFNRTAAARVGTATPFKGTNSRGGLFGGLKAALTGVSRNSSARDVVTHATKEITLQEVQEAAAAKIDSICAILDLEVARASRRVDGSEANDTAGSTISLTTPKSDASRSVIDSTGVEDGDCSEISATNGGEVKARGETSVVATPKSGTSDQLGENEAKETRYFDAVGLQDTLALLSHAGAGLKLVRDVFSGVLSRDTLFFEEADNELAAVGRIAGKCLRQGSLDRAVMEDVEEERRVEQKQNEDRKREEEERYEAARLAGGNGMDSPAAHLAASLSSSEDGSDVDDSAEDMGSTGEQCLDGGKAVMDSGSAATTTQNGSIVDAVSDALRGHFSLGRTRGSVGGTFSGGGHRGPGKRTRSKDEFEAQEIDSITSRDDISAMSGGPSAIGIIGGGSTSSVVAVGRRRSGASRMRAGSKPLHAKSSLSTAKNALVKLGSDEEDSGTDDDEKRVG